jgi:gluconolactonase
MVHLRDFRPVGSDLHRPEGVAIAPDGSVWASDQASAAARLEGDRAHPLGRAGGEPNGLNFLPGGELLIANFAGHLQVLDPGTGEVRTFVDEVEGRPVIHANYALADANGWVWATESTRLPVASAETAAQMLADPDGWIFVRRPDGTTQVVADGLAFANGLCLSADGEWLYVAETLNGRIQRARILGDGSLSELESVFVFPTDDRG